SDQFIDYDREAVCLAGVVCLKEGDLSLSIMDDLVPYYRAKCIKTEILPISSRALHDSSFLHGAEVKENHDDSSGNTVKVVRKSRGLQMLEEKQAQVVAEAFDIAMRYYKDKELFYREFFSDPDRRVYKQLGIPNDHEGSYQKRKEIDAGVLGTVGGGAARRRSSSHGQQRSSS
ncbi:unnamed protein product, partial [Amoebophrya sp. A25]